MLDRVFIRRNAGVYVQGMQLSSRNCFYETEQKTKLDGKNNILPIEIYIIIHIRRGHVTTETHASVTPRKRILHKHL